MQNKLNFLGRGAAYNAGEANNSAYMIKGDTMLLMDCGETVFKKLLGMNILENIKDIHILITHMHSDHVGSLGGFVGYCNWKYNIVSNIYFNEPESISEYLELLGMREGKVFNVHDADSKRIDSLGLEFSCILTKHAKALNCYSYILKFDEGNDIFYTGDSKETNIDIVPFLKDENIIYQDTCLDGGEGCPHTSLKELSERIPEEYRNKVYCMHIDCKELVVKAKELGFNVVEPV